MRDTEFWGLMVIVTVLAAASVILALKSTKDSMTVCQLSHSYDTCFQALNR